MIHERGTAQTMDNIAIYPGTFDPMTLGHMDIVSRACGLFNRIVVAVATGSGKEALFSLPEREELARQSLAEFPNVEVVSLDTLVVDLARKLEAHFLIRGLRAVSDFDYEFQLAAANRRLMPELETLFLMPAEPFLFLSSSMVREIAALGGDVSGLVPDQVCQALDRKLRHQGS